MALSARRVAGIVMAAWLLLWSGSGRIAAIAGEQVRATYVEEPEFGATVRLVEAGDHSRDTVLLVHGLGDAGSDDWKNVIPALSEKYRVIAPDLPGFARSEKANLLYSPTRYARFLKWLVDRYVVKGGKQSVIMVGHSMGGAIALRYAALYPDTLKRLVLVDAAGILHRSAFVTASVRHTKSYSDLVSLAGNSPGKVESLLGDLIAGSEGFPAPVDAVLESPFLRSLILRGSPPVIAALALLQEDFSRAIDRIDVPTAVIWGGNDRVAPLRTGKLLYSNLKHSSIDIMDGVGHVPMNEAAARFNHLLLVRLEKPLPRKIALNSRPGTKDIVCDSRQGMKLSGSYRNISIRSCSNVTMENVAARHIRIEDSDVEIYRAHIDGGVAGLDVRNSILMATALEIDADTTISVAGSSLDLAGVRLNCKKSAIAYADGEGSTALISVSKIGEEYLHAAFSLEDESESIPCRISDSRKME